MKKFLSLVVAALLSASAVATNVSAAKFTDVDVNNAALNDAVELLTALNVTKGTTDTTFGTEENVTRQQMAAFIYRMMKAGKSVEGGVNTTSFTDLDDSTYYFMVSWANSQGIIKGRSATTFDPKGGITLQDAYTMVVRALGYDDGTLTYPIGYISLAEDLGLDKDLPSALNYTDTLTRGNVAIILANMFYAETAEVELKYVSNFIQVCLTHPNGCEGKDTTKCNSPSIESTGTVPKEYHKTVAEAVFDVKQIRQRVVATPSYAIDYNTVPSTDRANYNEDIAFAQIEEDVPMVQLSTYGINDYSDYFEEGEEKIGSLGQREFAELGLEGEADDYFLNDIVMFVRVVDGETEIFGATATGSVKTVSFDDVKFGTVSGTSETKYYDGKEKEYKIINGKLTLDDTVTYLFDAPYTFTKGKNIYTPEFITLGTFAGDMEEEKIYKTYKAVNVALDEDIIGEYKELTDAAGNYVDENGNVVTDKKDAAKGWYYNGYLSEVYFDGLGEIDVYDCDNDGKPEYLFVKKFTTGVIDTEEDGSLEDTNYDATQSAESVSAKIFTDKSIVEGAEFKDGDIVVAYVNNDANYVKVAEVVEGKEASITTATNDYMVLSTGEKVFFEHAVLAVENGAANKLDTLYNDISFTSDATYYFTANGKLVYTKGLNAGVNVNEDYVVVLKNTIDENKGLVDGEFVEEAYIKIYHDGAIKFVKAKKVIAPDAGKTANGVWNADYTPATYDKNNNTWLGYGAYVNKLATAKADKDGYYYFKLVNETGVNSNIYATPADEEKALLALEEKGDKEDEKNEYRAEKVSSKFYQKSGYLYNLSDITNKTDDPQDSNDNVINGVYVKPYTKIIIKSQDKEGNEIVELYGYDNLPDIDENTVFSNVSYILLNNVNSKMYENLVVFYGEISAELEGSKGEVADIRVVKSSSFSYNEEGIIHFYDVYNPFDGKVETGLESVTASANKDDCYKTGAIVGLTTEKYIDNDNGLQDAGNAYVAGAIYNTEDDFETDIVNGTKLGYVEVADYDDVTKFLEIVGDKAMYQITDESVVTFSDKDDDDSFKVVDAEVLGSTSKSYRQGDIYKYTEKDPTTGKDVEKIVPLRVFLCVEVNEENEKDFNKGKADFRLYDVIFAMIVRD